LNPVSVTPVQPQQGSTPAQPQQGSTPVQPQHGSTPEQPQQGVTPVQPQHGSTFSDSMALAVVPVGGNSIDDELDSIFGRDTVDMSAGNQSIGWVLSIDRSNVPELEASQFWDFLSRFTQHQTTAESSALWSSSIPVLPLSDRRFLRCGGPANGRTPAEVSSFFVRFRERLGRGSPIRDFARFLSSPEEIRAFIAKIEKDMEEGEKIKAQQRKVFLLTGGKAKKIREVMELQ
jgi:hypothetical protein